MLTVSGICKSFTAKLDKVVKQQNVCAGLQDQTAETYEKDARTARLAASNHKAESRKAGKAINKIKEMFGE